VDELGHVIDSPGQWPQWQFHEGQRAALLESLGFRVDRETHRFEFHTGEEAFKAALIRVSEGSLDRRRLVKRHRLGPGAEAQDTFDQLKSMEYDPAWWEPAFTTDDRLADLEMPTQLPSAATIGYIGVAPEMRGERIRRGSPCTWYGHIAEEWRATRTWRYRRRQQAHGESLSERWISAICDAT
jgi:hypothetical protein